MRTTYLCWKTTSFQSFDHRMNRFISKKKCIETTTKWWTREKTKKHEKIEWKKLYSFMTSAWEYYWHLSEYISINSIYFVNLHEEERKRGQTQKSTKILLTFLFHAPYEQHFEIVCFFLIDIYKIQQFLCSRKKSIDSIKNRLPASKFACKRSWAKTKVKIYCCDVWLKQLKKIFVTSVDGVPCKCVRL